MKFWKNYAQAVQKPSYKHSLLLAVFIIGILIFCVSVSACTSSFPSKVSSSPTNRQVIPREQSVFDGDCGIAASAEMSSSIIGFPELTISITNISEKDISAIQFYAVPYDVYGEELHGIFRQSNLYTDTTIKASSSDTVHYQLIDDSVKTVELYVYSVYFTDGTEWGDKDATKSTIMSEGMLIDVSGETR